MINKIRLCQLNVSTVHLMRVLCAINDIICCLSQRQITLSTEIVGGQHYKGIYFLKK